MTRRGVPGFIVAIDGPAGSGKSTTARLVAQALGFRHLDTGAMYRAVTLKVIETGTRLSNRVALARLLSATRVGMDWQDGKVRVWLDRRDRSEAIRHPAVSALVSEVSAIPAVRHKLVAEQRRIARRHNVVCEGRDIGSVVFPGAQLKVYLDCSADARAARRRLELQEKGTRVSGRAVLANLRKRDRMDSGRRMSPLVRTPDAVLIDTTHLTVEEQVAVVCELTRRRTATSSVCSRLSSLRRTSAPGPMLASLESSNPGLPESRRR
jgi:cytidylate kinase